jgi:hypothetical protein
MPAPAWWLASLHIHSRVACRHHATNQDFANRTGIICCDLSSVKRGSCGIDNEFVFYAKAAKHCFLDGFISNYDAESCDPEDPTVALQHQFFLP